MLQLLGDADIIPRTYSQHVLDLERKFFEAVPPSEEDTLRKQMGLGPRHKRGIWRSVLSLPSKLGSGSGPSGENAGKEKEESEIEERGRNMKRYLRRGNPRTPEEECERLVKLVWERGMDEGVKDVVKGGSPTTGDDASVKVASTSLAGPPQLTVPIDESETFLNFWAHQDGEGLPIPTVSESIPPSVPPKDPQHPSTSDTTGATAPATTSLILRQPTSQARQPIIVASSSRSELVVASSSAGVRNWEDSVAVASGSNLGRVPTT